MKLVHAVRNYFTKGELALWLASLALIAVSFCLFDRNGWEVLHGSKVHTCGFAEDKCVTAGDDFSVCDLETAEGTVRVGALLGFDAEFSESARILMLEGAELVLAPQACAMGADRLALLRGYAYENMYAVASVNYPAGACRASNGHSSVYDGVSCFPGGGCPRETCLLQAGEEEGLGRVLTPRVKQFIVDKRLYTDYRPIVEKLKAELPAGLFAHSLRSAEWAVTHAWLQGTGFKESFLAALLHDSAKPFSPMFPMDTYPVGTAKPVCHQYDGGYRVVHDFGITDPAIVDAVTYHTTARANMTKLDELVYLADKLEKGRNYPGVDELRAIGEKSVSDAVAASLKRSDEYLSGKGERPDALTLQAIEWYNQKNGRHNGT